MDLFAAQKDSILSLINDILVKGELVCPIEDVVCVESEEVIGELTDYEKAIYLARNVAADQFNAMAEEISSEVEKNPESEPDIKKLERQKSVHELLNQLFWENIRFRLNGKNTTSVGIRQDWQIVAITHNRKNLPEKCKDCEKLEHCPIVMFVED